MRPKYQNSITKIQNRRIRSHKYTYRSPKLGGLKSTQRDPNLTHWSPKSTPKGQKWTPRDQNLIPRGKKYTQRGPKWNPRGVKTNPRSPKSTPNDLDTQRPKIDYHMSNIDFLRTKLTTIIKNQLPEVQKWLSGALNDSKMPIICYRGP